MFKQFFIAFNFLFAICLQLAIAVPVAVEDGIQAFADESDIHFYLFTLTNPTDQEELFLDNVESLFNSSYVAGAPVKVITHGFQTGCPHELMQNNRLAWLDLGEPVNVICVDWKELAQQLYDVAAENTRMVGQKTSRLINFLIENSETELKDFHVQGHSLGAHVAGFTGFYLQESGTGKIPIITALDPALPLFGVAPEPDRLDPTDADFVSVIHTAGGVIGFEDPLGHADFFPNGGKKQPGCGVDIGWACSHLRAANLVIESIGTGPRFNACKCESWESFDDGTCTCEEKAEMGVYTDTSARGLYYLRTNEESPFAQG